HEPAAQDRGRPVRPAVPPDRLRPGLPAGGPGVAVSFRLRVLVLVALVAVVATGVTAWLTLQQASRQITESADVRRETTDLVAGAITEYGRVHGTWEGVAWLVANLGSRTGERIRLTRSEEHTSELQSREKLV